MWLVSMDWVYCFVVGCLGRGVSTQQLNDNRVFEVMSPINNGYAIFRARSHTHTDWIQQWIGVVNLKPSIKNISPFLLTTINPHYHSDVQCTVCLNAYRPVSRKMCVWKMMKFTNIVSHDRFETFTKFPIQHDNILSNPINIYYTQTNQSQTS